MKIGIDDARRLTIDAFVRAGMLPDHAAMIADHIVHAQAADDVAGGLARVLALVDEFRQRPATTPISTVARTRSSAVIDGGGHTGYVTSVIAMDQAVGLARETGIGLVGLRNSWFSGQLAYYVERAARDGFLALHCTNAKARVAPSGGIDAILGTNPLAFGFPADPRPVVIDIGTSAVTVAELMLRQKQGRALDHGMGIDGAGQPTTDPAAAWSGAILPWGGHRGYGIALAVQLLGMLAGGATVVHDVAESGFFFLVLDPELLMPRAEFSARAAELVRHIEQSRPAGDAGQVRVHGTASARRRDAAHARGYFEIDDAVYRALLEMREGRYREAALSNHRGAGR